MRLQQRGIRTSIVLIAAGAAGLALASPVAAAPPPARVKVPNAQPSLSRAKVRGKADRTKVIDVRLYLAARDSGAMMDAVRSVSTPGAAGYRKYMSPSQFRAAYAPSDASVSAVTAFVKQSGLTVTSIPASRLYVEASGTVAEVQQAFGTSLIDYAMDGRTVRAAATSPTIPDSLASTVVAVSGLASEAHRMTPSHEDGPTVAATSPVKAAAASSTSATASAPPPDAFVNATPCSAYYGQKIATTLPGAYGSKQPYVPCGYVPKQLQGAYGLSSLIGNGVNGKGVTVAITDAYAAPTIASDANTYATRHGQRAFSKGQFTQVLPSSYNNGYDDTVNGDVCGEQGWYGEETLDVEAVHALAPGANVTYVASSSCFDDDFLAALSKIVDGHLADIVTNSWGDNVETEVTRELDVAYTRVFAQAALEGIGFYYSSGDDGDASADTTDGSVAVGSPSNNPLVTGVGGTSLAIGAKNQRLWETGWSTSSSTLTDGAWDPAPPGTYLYGAGGGTSQLYAQPWYQKGVVPASLSRIGGNGAKRVVPDISAVGDPQTGMLIGETQTFPDGSAKYSEYRIGGTSLSSPVMAGIMAIADQKAGYAHGFANPLFYKAYGSSGLYDPKPKPNTAVVRVNYANSVDATDGTSTILRTIDATTGTTLRVTAGYDNITGVGSPSGAAFIASIS